MKKIISRKTMLAIILLTVTLFCSIFCINPSADIADAATAPQANWQKVKIVNTTYNGSNYRITLFKDINFNSKQVLFTSTPVNHCGNELDYTVSINESKSTELSESVGVSVTAEMKAFGNGVKSSLGITSTITSSFSTSTSDSHSLLLNEDDEDGFWAVYGYNRYDRYKIETELITSKQVLVKSEPIYGWVKSGKDNVYTCIGYMNSYKSVTAYVKSEQYCGEFLTAQYKPNKFIFDYMYLSKNS